MNLLPVSKVFAALRADGHFISRNDLYALVRDGSVPSVKGKTTVEAVLNALAQRLGTPLPVLPANPPRRNDYTKHGSKPTHDRRLSLPSTYPHQIAAASKSK